MLALSQTVYRLWTILLITRLSLWITRQVIHSFPQGVARAILSTTLSTSYPQVIHNLIHKSLMP